MPAEKNNKAVPVSKLMVSVAVVGIVAIAAYNWIVSPQTGYLKATQRYQTIIGYAEQKKQVIRNKVGMRQAELLKLKSEITKSQKGFFTAEQAKRFFLGLDPLAVKNNCKVRNLNFLPDSSAKETDKKSQSRDLIARQAAVSLSGGYNDIVNVLKAMNAYSQKVCISELNIVPGQDEKADLKCDMIITVYVIDDKGMLPDES